MNDKSHIPPAIRLLAEQDLSYFSSPRDLFKQYNRIAKEVASQAEWTCENFDYFDHKSKQPGSLIITASGGLNPFSEHDICSQPACRTHAALQIARTLGLYADVVLIPDVLSYSLADMRKPTHAQMEWILTQMLVVKVLYPLIEAGVIRFWSGSMAVCRNCQKLLKKQIKEGTAILADELHKYIHVEIKGDLICIRTTGMMEGPTIFIRELKQEEKRKLKSGVSLNTLAKKIYCKIIEERINNTLCDLRFSEAASSMLFSTSRSELYALRSYDKDAPAISNLAVWEKTRSIQLPWVNEMTPQQVVDLRDAASKALPGFRETFVRQIASPSASIESVANKIDELRNDAIEVEREIAALNPLSEDNFRNLAGALGITVSVYGFAAGFTPPAVALGGLITLLGLVHTSSRHDELEKAKLVSQPAYVLVKAKELIEHAP